MIKYLIAFLLLTCSVFGCDMGITTLQAKVCPQMVKCELCDGEDVIYCGSCGSDYNSYHKCTHPSIRVDTTEKYIQTYDMNYYPPMPNGARRVRVIDTTVIEDSIGMAITDKDIQDYKVDDTDFLNRCKLLPPTQPLISKIDTVRVDTVGFYRDSIGTHTGTVGAWSCDLLWIQNGVYNRDSCRTSEHYTYTCYWVPVLEYTTKEYYYLSPEQVKILGGVK